MSGTFSDLNLNPVFIEGLKKQQINTPTEIQLQAFDEILKKKDVIICSQTGTGKTLSYLLPIFSNVDITQKFCQAIIVTPTHELSVQVFKQVELLAKNSGHNVKSALIIGSANINRQIDVLKSKPHIIVGSHGRILDVIKKRKLSVHNVKTIVIDECDRLLDDKNIEDIKALVKTTLKERQLVFASASVSNETIAIAKDIGKDVVEINVSKNEIVPKNITHSFIKCEWREKLSTLRKIVSAEKVESGIVFINNVEKIQVLVDKLNYHGVPAVGIFGKADKNKRREALDKFKNKKVKLLVASDLGARGIDIPFVTHVFNLDIPEDPTFYLHRAGRTGRNNKDGETISIITDYEKQFVNKYKTKFNIEIDEKILKYGKFMNKIKKHQKNV